MNLAGVLQEYGWSDQGQHEAVIKIMELSGCFDDGGFGYKDDEFSVQHALESEFTVERLNQLMQEHMLRRLGLERSMLISNPILDKQLEASYRILGMIDEIIPPPDSKYDAILLLGSSQSSFEVRVRTLEKLVEGRHISGTIYCLGSNRKLWPDLEPLIEVVLSQNSGMDIEQSHQFFMTRKIPTGLNPEDLKAARTKVYNDISDMGLKVPSEAEMMYQLINESDILKNIEHIKVEADNKPDGRRADTEDTIVKFKEIFGDAQGRDILIISDQPVALYQREPVKKVMQGANVFVAANKISKVNSAIINDSIARMVYSKYEQMSK